MKDGWDKSKERYEAWWNRSAVDRVLLQVLALSKSRRSDPAPAPETGEKRWLDADWRISSFERAMEDTYFGGDAFPYLDTHIGPGTMSLYLGAIPEFQPNTVWYHRCIDDITKAETPEYDEGNRFWKFSREFARQGMERLKGRALVSFPDLIEGLDTISSLIGNHELLLALVDSPDDIHRFQDPLTDLYFDYHDPLYNIIKDESGGSCFSAFRIWGPGTVAKLQCDFSAMISPEMFEEFVVPYMEEQCARLDYSVYHLDGHCALQHLDLLLGMKHLNAIQWTPGAGFPNPCAEEYTDLHRRILASGKASMILGGTPAEAKALVEKLGPEGLDIVLSAQSQDEADAIVKDSFSWRQRGG